ncbi:MAG TPA: LPXTG cell wall anchor domain-containing protein [Allosphingosinicella sp.]|nr:LPXTG cell wall anchor domain-containing protein [Allosphingosinicella sp.]
MATGSGAALLSIAMIAAFLLGAGGVWLIARRRDPRKGLLMLVAALVVLGNVLVWTV